MSNVEREYIKSVDDVILKASGNSLKKLQELDVKTQLRATTFYDAYAVFHEESTKEKIPSTTKSSSKNKSL